VDPSLRNITVDDVNIKALKNLLQEVKVLVFSNLTSIFIFVTFFVTFFNQSFKFATRSERKK